MNIDSVLASIGIYLAVISALAIGVERIMDFLKFTPKLDKTLIRKPKTAKLTEEELTQDDARQRRVRLWAVLFGLILAFIMQIDTFDLLGLTSPMWFGYPILGYIMTGLAASRGSAFWHDILEIVKIVKETKRDTALAKQGG